MIRKVIAGVEFAIEFDPGFEIVERNPVDEIFFSPPEFILSNHRIHIEICTDSIPDIESSHYDLGQILFSVEPSWYISQNKQFFFIVQHPLKLTHPLWVARFDKTFKQGVIYCSELMLDRRKEKTVLYNPVNYPLDQILLMHILSKIGGLVIHSAGWVYNNKGWIFAGKSGAGKSTIAKLIEKSSKGSLLSDDRIVIRKMGEDFLMYGTPWPGEAGYAMNMSAPLNGIFFIEPGQDNVINKLSPAESISRLFPVVSIPWYDQEKVDQMMIFCESLMDKIPMYQLTFKPEEAVVETLIGFMNE